MCVLCVCMCMCVCVCVCVCFLKAVVHLCGMSAAPQRHWCFSCPVYQLGLILSATFAFSHMNVKKCWSDEEILAFDSKTHQKRNTQRSWQQQFKTGGNVPYLDSHWKFDEQSYLANWGTHPRQLATSAKDSYSLEKQVPVWRSVCQEKHTHLTLINFS